MGISSYKVDFPCGIKNILCKIWRDLKVIFPEGRVSPLPAEYEQMVLDNQHAKLKNNILAATFAWILLAGYLVFPNTFSTLRTSNALQLSVAQSEVGEFSYKLVLSIPLLTLAAICYVISSCGLI